MNTNLLSVSQLTAEGYRVRFNDDAISISSGRTKILAKKTNGLYVLDLKIPAQVIYASVASEEEAVSLRAAHEALSHVGIDKVRKTLKDLGLPFVEDMDECDACLRGKQHRQPSRSKPSSTRAERPGHLWADVCSATEMSMDGKKHFLCITDENSRFRSVHFLREKSEVAQCV